jgi:hypothetical protein
MKANEAVTNVCDRLKLGGLALVVVAVTFMGQWHSVAGGPLSHVAVGCLRPQVLDSPTFSNAIESNLMFSQLRLVHILSSSFK